MGEQIVDLRATGAVLRRHRGTIAFIGLVGALLGAGVPLLRPPMYTSTSEVLLPTPATTSQQSQVDPQTQVEIASSAAVLGPVGTVVHPALTFRELGQRIKVSAPSNQTLVFTASARTAADAERLASTAATSEADYVAAAASRNQDHTLVTALHKVEQEVTELRQAIHSSQGAQSPAAGALSAELATATGELQTLTTAAAPTPGTATILQPASPATRPGAIGTYLVPVAGGLLAGLLIAAIGVLLTARLDRRLRSRDRLATTVGTAVIASFAGRSARGIGAWHHLIAGYRPNPVDAWALRQILRELPTRPDGTRAVTVVSLDNDHKGMALGPLLASYAASEGIETELVVSDAARPSAMAGALRRSAGTELRPRLRVSDGEATTTSTLRVTVVAVSASEVPGIPVSDQGETPVVLSIAAGAATAKQAAYVAMAADAAGRVVGLVVVDPDASDRTRGRLPGSQHDLSTRLPRIGVKGAQQ